MSLKCRGFNEGDYIETIDGLFFAVKGNRHLDDKIIAYLRYIPDRSGSRILGATKYKRLYDLKKTTEYLQKKYPKYLNYIPWLNQTLQTVPFELIKKIYRPEKKLAEVLCNPSTELRKIIKEFVEEISLLSKISTSKMGISGSLLIGLENETSDIDLNIYGRKAGKKAYRAIKHLREEVKWVSSYDYKTIKSVFESRWGKSSLNRNKLIEIEMNKVLHGLVHGVDYFIRLLKEDSNSSTSIPIRKVKFRGTVYKSDEIFTPCNYRLKNIDDVNSLGIKTIDIVSYRGKFTEMTKCGDFVEVQGKLEKLLVNGGIFYQVILTEMDDYIIPISVLNG
jgi:predicted nucleotidyltransferase